MKYTQSAAGVHLLLKHHFSLHCLRARKHSHTYFHIWLYIHNAAAPLYTPPSRCAEHEWRKCFWTEGPSLKLSTLHNPLRAAMRRTLGVFSKTESRLIAGTFRGWFVCLFTQRGGWMQAGQLRWSIICYLRWLRLLTAATRWGLASAGFWRPKSRPGESGPAGCDAEPAADTSHDVLGLGQVWDGDWTELRESQREDSSVNRFLAVSWFVSQINNVAVSSIRVGTGLSYF